MKKDDLILNSVHDGLVEAIILLKQARDKINYLAEDKELESFSRCYSVLSGISDNLIKGECDISELIGVIFFDRFEKELEKKNA